MSRNIFDYEKGNFATLISDTMAMDPNGDLFIRMGENMAMDLETGDLHCTSGWETQEED